MTLQISIVDASTGEQIVRDMTKEEEAEFLDSLVSKPLTTAEQNLAKSLLSNEATIK